MVGEHGNIKKQLESFPDVWRALLKDALGEWCIHSMVRRRNLAGKSGASLWVVDVQGQSYDGSAILKVSGDEVSAQEIKNHEQALALNPIKNRIPELLFTFA
ncbi:MAG: hypothetical protein HQL84_12990 [Magnetococcales bacterium]|nr:hypothetical protein [Magnetococcales bacterium]MBF0150949.1 hypothetical protein [Magnetococcales bacterium]